MRLTAGGITQSDEVRSGGSYLSQSEFGLHFGLGSARRVDRVEIRWPNGSGKRRPGLRPTASISSKKQSGNSLALNRLGKHFSPETDAALVIG